MRKRGLGKRRLALFLAVCMMLSNSSYAYAAEELPKEVDTMLEEEPELQEGVPEEEVLEEEPELQEEVPEEEEPEIQEEMLEEEEPELQEGVPEEEVLEEEPELQEEVPEEEEPELQEEMPEEEESDDPEEVEEVSVSVEADVLLEGEDEIIYEELFKDRDYISLESTEGESKYYSLTVAEETFVGFDPVIYMSCTDADNNEDVRVYYCLKENKKFYYAYLDPGNYHFAVASYESVSATKKVLDGDLFAVGAGAEIYEGKQLEKFSGEITSLTASPDKRNSFLYQTPDVEQKITFTTPVGGSVERVELFVYEKDHTLRFLQDSNRFPVSFSAEANKSYVLEVYTNDSCQIHMEIEEDPVIEDSYDIASLHPYLEQTEYEYTGMAIYPTIRFDEGYEYFLNYTAQYSNNLGPDATAEVTVTGTYPYSGTVTLQYTIGPRDTTPGVVYLGGNKYNISEMKTFTSDSIILTDGYPVVYETGSEDETIVFSTNREQGDSFHIYKYDEDTGLATLIDGMMQLHKDCPVRCNLEKDSKYIIQYGITEEGREDILYKERLRTVTLTGQYEAGAYYIDADEMDIQVSDETGPILQNIWEPEKAGTYTITAILPEGESLEDRIHKLKEVSFDEETDSVSLAGGEYARVTFSTDDVKYLMLSDGIEIIQNFYGAAINRVNGIDYIEAGSGIQMILRNTKGYSVDLSIVSADERSLSAEVDKVYQVEAGESVLRYFTPESNGDYFFYSTEWGINLKNVVTEEIISPNRVVSLKAGVKYEIFSCYVVYNPAKCGLFAVSNEIPVINLENGSYEIGADTYQIVKIDCSDAVSNEDMYVALDTDMDVYGEGLELAYVAETKCYYIPADGRETNYIVLLKNDSAESRTFRWVSRKNLWDSMAVPIEKDVLYTVEHGGAVVRSFTPEKEGYYYFYAEKSGEPYGVDILDSSLNWLECNDEGWFYYLEAEKTYYLPDCPSENGRYQMFAVSEAKKIMVPNGSVTVDPSGLCLVALSCSEGKYLQEKIDGVRITSLLQNGSLDIETIDGKDYYAYNLYGENNYALIVNDRENPYDFCLTDALPMMEDVIYQAEGGDTIKKYYIPEENGEYFFYTTGWGVQLINSESPDQYLGRNLVVNLCAGERYEILSVYGDSEPVEYALLPVRDNLPQMDLKNGSCEIEADGYQLVKMLHGNEDWSGTLYGDPYEGVQAYGDAIRTYVVDGKDYYYLYSGEPGSSYIVLLRNNLEENYTFQWTTEAELWKKTAVSIEEGVLYSVAEGKQLSLSFTPTETGFYCFYAEQQLEYEWDLYIYDEDDNYIDSSFGGLCYLTGGETYYLRGWAPEGSRYMVLAESKAKSMNVTSDTVTVAPFERCLIHLTGGKGTYLQEIVSGVKSYFVTEDGKSVDPVDVVFGEKEYRVYEADAEHYYALILNDRDETYEFQLSPALDFYPDITSDLDMSVDFQWTEDRGYENFYFKIQIEETTLLQAKQLYGDDGEVVLNIQADVPCGEIAGIPYVILEPGIYAGTLAYVSYFCEPATILLSASEFETLEPGKEYQVTGDDTEKIQAYSYVPAKSESYRMASDNGVVYSSDELGRITNMSRYMTGGKQYYFMSYGASDYSLCLERRVHVTIKDYDIYHGLVVNQSGSSLSWTKVPELDVELYEGYTVQEEYDGEHKYKFLGTINDREFYEAAISAGFRRGFVPVKFYDENKKEINRDPITEGMTIYVKYEPEKVYAQSVKLNASSVNVKQGSSYTLKATLSSGNVYKLTDTKVTWTSSNTKVATVSSTGVVQGIGTGTATITAKTSNGKTATCKVTVGIPATAVTISKTSVTINKGKTYTLIGTMTPSNTTDKLTWSSSDTKVAKVSSAGVVTGVGRGTATITVTSTSGKKASCKVTVKVPASAVVLSKSSLSIYKGKTYTLKGTMAPSDTTDTLTWSSSNTRAAKVSSTGVVTGVAKGTATITVKTTSGKTAACTVTVKEIPSTSVKLNKTSVSVNQGKTYTLTATMGPSNSTDTLTWSSSNTKVAKVSSTGVVTGVAKGTATITVKTTSGKTATCKVTVKVPSTAVTMSKTSVTIYKGKTYTLKGTMAPSNSTDTLTWSSSNTKVAKVSSTGVVTGVAKGTATITVKTTSGKTATCTVTVKVSSTAVTMSKTAVTINMGKTYTLKGTMTPSDTTDTLTWSSSNTKVAKVSSTGVVTGVTKGTATITVKTTSGKTATCKVTVKVPSTTVTMSKTSVSIYRGKTYTLKGTMTPSDTTDTLTWSSSNTRVAQVSSTGVVTGVAKGTATITVKTTSGKTATCKVTVKEIPSTSVKMSKTSVSITKGKTYTLTATKGPSNTTDTLTWSSSNTRVAKVSSTGVVTGVAKGTATITVKTTSGKTATCKVTIK